jgi:hypothetical protein
VLDEAVAAGRISTELLGAPLIRGAVQWEIVRPEVSRDGAGGQHVRADRRRAIVRVPSVATFAVQDGERVFYDPAPGAHPADIEAYLHATVTALLLAQQNRFALHATSVRVDGADVALAGVRGAGKSTTALALSRRGHRPLCDDVLPLEPEARQTRHIPTLRPLRIAPATAVALGIDVSGAPEPGPLAGKLTLPCERVAPSRLDAIVVLQPAAETVAVRRIDRTRAVPLVFAHAYKRALLAPWQQEVFRWSAAVSETVPLFLLERPSAGWSAGEVAATVEKVVRSLPRRGLA